MEPEAEAKTEGAAEPEAEAEMEPEVVAEAQMAEPDVEAALEPMPAPEPPKKLPSIPGLTKKQIEKLKVTFDKIDADGSGELDAEELKQAMSESGREVTIEEATEMIAQTDLTGSGTIHFEG